MQAIGQLGGRASDRIQVGGNLGTMEGDRNTVSGEGSRDGGLISKPPNSRLRMPHFQRAMR